MFFESDYLGHPLDLLSVQNISIRLAKALSPVEGWKSWASLRISDLYTIQSDDILARWNNDGEPHRDLVEPGW